MLLKLRHVIAGYIKPGKIDPEVPDPKKAILNRQAKSLGLVIAASVLATVVFPFGMQNAPIADFGAWIAIIMAVGLIVLGLWGVLELLWPDPVTKKKYEDRRNSMFKIGLTATFLAVVMFLLNWLVAAIGAMSWFSYDVLKSGGMITYIVLGSLPVIGYALAMYAVATRQIISNKTWRKIAIVGLVFSLMAPWFWAGYRMYLDYHVV